MPIKQMRENYTTALHYASKAKGKERELWLDQANKLKLMLNKRGYEV